MRTSTLFGALAGAALLTLGGVALAKRKPEEGPFFLYTVQPGDALSALALRFFGDAKKWPVITELNNDVQGLGVDQVPVGAKLRIPCVWETVRPGDNLAAVAKRALGDAGRWRRIYEANKQALPDPDKLGVGQRLAVPMEVPPKARPVSVSVGALELLGAEHLP